MMRPYYSYPEWIDTDEEKAAYDEIMSNMPALMAQRHDFLKAYLHPTNVIIPIRLKSKEEGISTLMGLPVIWAETETWGVVVGLLTKKEN